MGTPSIVFGFVGRTVASVLIVALLLLLAAPARDALVPAVSSLWRWPEVRSALEQIANEVGVQADSADGRFEQLRRRPANEIDTRKRAIDARLTELSGPPQLASASYLALAQALAQGNLEKALKAEVERRVLLQERDALLYLYAYAMGAAGPQARQQDEERKRRLASDAKRREVDAEARVRLLEPQVWCRVPGTDCASELKKARLDWIEANAEARRTYRAWADANEAVPRSALIGTPPSFRVDRAGVQAVLDAMSREVSRVASWHVTTAQPIWDALYSAVLIVVASLASLVGMKALFYYGLARLAEHRPPLFVQHGARRVITDKAPRSVLSLQVLISPKQELVALGSHLQSVGDGARTRTQWLLSVAHPLTSLLSGLWMLTRLRTTVPCTVVLSATTDALEELNAVTLEEGDAMVLLPKHLVGAIHPAGRPVRLVGHWKGGIHAWLTLQFRYLVFEGPCTLIVGGCRGVRVESADNGRSVNQAMTVGFSSHIAYSVARTETFTAYLLGQRPLFNDRFLGPGVVLYQEVPSTAQRAGFTGRGLQGVADGAMKAFGL